MILHPEAIVIQNGDYRLCESAFVGIDLWLVPNDSTQLLAIFTVCDALQRVYSKVRSEPFSLARFSLAVVECFPIDLNFPPRNIPANDPCLINWTSHPLHKRSLIYLHAIYDGNKKTGRKVPFFSFILRLLEHTPGLKLMFQMEGDCVKKITAHFGDQALGRSGFVVEGVLGPGNEIRERAFVPISETSET